jgi:pimeloyl-ACP methyl ester carboxylesterase
MAAALGSALAGCSYRQQARLLIQPDTQWGCVNESVAGSPRRLVERKIVTAVRRTEVAEEAVIDAWVIAGPAGVAHRGAVVVLHGLCDSKITYLRMAGALAPKGYDFVLLDLRAHGRSTGNYFTYGCLERHDVKAAVDGLLKEGLISGPLYVMGVEVGGLVGLQYAALDGRVAGVIAVGAPKDFRSVARRMYSAASQEELEKIVAASGRMGGFDPAEASGLAAVAKYKGPVLFYHGLFDMAVPYADSEALASAAAGPTRLVPMTAVSRLGTTLLSDAAVLEALERLHNGQLGEEPASQPVGPAADISVPASATTAPGSVKE